MLFLLEYVEPTNLAWVFGLSAVLALAMGFATGANDVANTFGTSVGSGALTIKKALIAAGIFELAGALALGSRVAGTIKSGISNYECFQGDESLYMIGMMSALASSATWLILASLLGLPVSTTHSIVGGVIGMTISLKGFKCVNWGFDGIGRIALSWITSPLLAGLASFALYHLICNFILKQRNPVDRALWATPLLFASAVAFLEMLILWDILKLAVYYKILIVLGSFVVVFVLAWFAAIPFLRNQISNFYFETYVQSLPVSESSSNLQELNDNKNDQNDVKMQEETSDDQNQVELEDQNQSKQKKQKRKEQEMDNQNEDLEEMDDDDKDANESRSSLVALDLESQNLSEENIADSIASPFGTPSDSNPINLEVQRSKQVFWWLQNFTACFGAFAHGANDTANAIGPFAAIYYLWKDGVFSPASEAVPIWIAALGGVSIVIGLATLGYKVIQTMGTDITHVDYVSGFSSELSSSVTVVVASRLHIPVSSTHCQVGAIVGTGLVDSDSPGITANHASSTAGSSFSERLKNVNWKLFGKIALSWVVTLPISGFVAAFLAFLLKFAVKK